MTAYLDFLVPVKSCSVTVNVYAAWMLEKSARFRPSDNDGVTFGDFDDSFNLHCRSDDPLKIVAVALVVSIGVAAFGIAARVNTDDGQTAQVIKAKA